MGREARVIRRSEAAGLRVPHVLVDSDDPDLWGSAGMVMGRIDGETLGRRILRDAEYADARGVLAEQCAEFLAGLHAIDPDEVGDLPGDDVLASFRERFDLLGEPSPVFEVAMRWLADDRPPSRRRAIVHGDFRLGNLIVGPDGLRAVLDWEVVHAGDPIEDLGWLCVRTWRFGGELPVGGFGTREQLTSAYQKAGGDPVDPEVLHWWEVLGTLRWGLGTIGQAQVHLTGAVRSVRC